MKCRNKISFLLAVTAMGLTACTKHHDDIEEYIPAAVINFSSPTVGAVFYSGDSVNVKAVAISSESIHGYDMIIRNPGDTAKLYFKHFHDHNDTLMIDQKWADAHVNNSNLEAEITLYLDHDGHTKRSSVLFRIN